MCVGPWVDEWVDGWMVRWMNGRGRPRSVSDRGHPPPAAVSRLVPSHPLPKPTKRRAKAPKQTVGTHHHTHARTLSLSSSHCRNLAWPRKGAGPPMMLEERRMTADPPRRRGRSCVCEVGVGGSRGGGGEGCPGRGISLIAPAPLSTTHITMWRTAAPGHHHHTNPLVKHPSILPSLPAAARSRRPACSARRR